MNNDNRRLNSDMNTARINVSRDDRDSNSLFPAFNLNKKTSDNLAKAEKMVDEKPLRTEKTEELEKYEK